MTTLEITNSSAITQVSFQEDRKIVGVCFTSSDKVYEFYCDDIQEVKDKIISTYEKDESVGKLINNLRRDGSLLTILVEEPDESQEEKTE